MEGGDVSGGLGDWWRGLIREFGEQDALDLALRLTLVLLIVRPGEHWGLVIAITNLAIVGLICPPLLRNRHYWLAITIILGFVNNFLFWDDSDNHKHLITYWCLAITCSLATRDPARTLATNGRILVGLVFFFATFWKATSLVYLRGDAFHFYLISDVRFFPIAYLLGGFTPEMMEVNEAAISKLRYLNATIPLESTTGVVATAYFLTWWTILIEALLAGLFLYGGGRRVAGWRHLVLITFIVTTYPPTNVILFGWIIIVMAMASCPAERKRTRLAYLTALLFIFCFSTGKFRELFLTSIQG